MYDMLISCVNGHGIHDGFHPSLPLCTGGATDQADTKQPTAELVERHLSPGFSVYILIGLALGQTTHSWTYMCACFFL